MKRRLLIVLLSTLSATTFAQEEEAKDSVQDGWKRAGNLALMFNQAAFNSEWTGGGTSNYAVNLAFSYDFNYTKGKIVWDNRIIADYGLTKSKNQEFTRKTNDRLEFNSILGRQIKESNWYYSFFLNFKTQFSSGYEYFENAAGGEDRIETTKFMSPGYLQVGPGMLWKKSDNLKVNFAPATVRLIFVSSEFTDVGDDPAAIAAFNENPYFGVEANESVRLEFGAAINAYAKFDVMKHVTVENVLNLYSNYLEDPQNVDIDYTLNVIMTVNKWITANAVLQTIYDDNAVKGVQVREALGIGVTYAF